MYSAYVWNTEEYDAVAHLDTLRLGLGGHGGDEAAALLAADERELALVQTAAMVRVDEVDAAVLVLDEDAAGRELRDGVVVLHLHHGRRAGLANDRGALMRERERGEGASVRSMLAGEMIGPRRDVGRAAAEKLGREMGGCGSRTGRRAGGDRTETHHDLGHGGVAAGAESI